MPQELSFISILVQGGAVGIALVCLFIIYKMNMAQTNTLNQIADDHRKTIDRNTDAWLQNTEVLSKINERIK